MEGWVYLLTNRPNGTLYVGVTSNLPKRIWQHRQGEIDGFTKRHQIRTLVYFENHASIGLAIEREKVIKHWKREWKVRLILETNPGWIDLFHSLL